MKKEILSLFLFVPIILLFGWFAARDSQYETIRGDCVAGAYAVGISAIILSIGLYLNKIVLAANVLRYGSLVYIVSVLAILCYQYNWSQFKWWTLPLGLFILGILSIPACLVYYIASDTIKSANKAQ